MNETVQLNLAFILFLPWYAILAVLFWMFPTQPRSLMRWCFDVGSLTVATLATVASMQWSYLSADKAVDAMWPQVLATSVSYGVFLGVMTAAFFIRRRFIVARPLAQVANANLVESRPGATS